MTEVYFLGVKEKRKEKKKEKDTATYDSTTILCLHVSYTLEVDAVMLLSRHERRFSSEGCRRMRRPKGACGVHMLAHARYTPTMFFKLLKYKNALYCS
jgi:hypothetical protein